MKRVGNLSRYCKELSNESYFCDYKSLSPEQLEELGLKSWGMYEPPAKSDLVLEELCKMYVKEIEEETPPGMVHLYHGTSKQYPIMKNGFEASPGILGTGVYFTRPWSRFSNEIIEEPIMHAKKFEKGVVFNVTVPESDVKDYHSTREMERCDATLTNARLKQKCKEGKIRGYSRLKKNELVKTCCKKKQTLGNLQSKMPAQVEMLFNKKGYMFDTPREMHDEYKRLGDVIRDHAMKNGIKAFDDGSQVIVYDVEWLNSLKREDMIECETGTKLEF